MARYRKKPVVIEASRWHKIGDHDHVVAYRKMPERYLGDPCKYCGQPMGDHGWVKTLEGGHIACPGDWIITGVEGEHYPCKPSVFDETYEPADPA